MAAQPLATLPRTGPEPAPGIDLDTHISLVEQRLALQVQQLGQRVRQAAAPRMLFLKLAGAALAGAGMVWTLRRGAGAGMARVGPAPTAPTSGPSPLLLSLLPMAWPLLPARWRGRISPATAATALSLAVPLIERLLARRGARADGDAPATVAQLDLLRFAGTWHEQARLPVPFESLCEGQPCASYTPLGGQLAVHNECRSADGRLRATDGIARVVPGSGGARLQVTFAPTWLRWLTLVWADLWVLHVDDTAPDYRVAIAGHPSRQGLWLLSRSPQLPADELQRLVARANALGYATDRLVLASPPTLH